MERAEGHGVQYINQLNVFARLRGLQDLTIQNAAKMPIVIDIENDSLVKANARRIIKRLLDMGQLTIADIAKAVNVTQELVLQIKEELTT